MGKDNFDVDDFRIYTRKDKSETTLRQGKWWWVLPVFSFHIMSVEKVNFAFPAVHALEFCLN